MLAVTVLSMEQNNATLAEIDLDLILAATINVIGSVWEKLADLELNASALNAAMALLVCVSSSTE